MQGIWSQEFNVRHYELDARGQLSVPFACRMLQEAAANHTKALKIDLETLRPHNLTWVLSSFRVKFEPPAANVHWPGWRDNVTADTWCSGIEQFFALRDYRLWDHSRQLLLSATSFWVLFDTEQRRMAMIPEFISATYPKSAERSLSAKLERIPRQTRVDCERRFQVNRADIDRNSHANNVSYVSWALETVPPSVFSNARLAEFDILFHTETVYGDLIHSTAEQNSLDGEHVFNHLLRREGDGKSVAQLRSRWAPEL